jgi:ornithine cyclodeaminase/alanine dehydrogenase-like protein (mu-crystallin family)
MHAPPPWIGQEELLNLLPMEDAISVIRDTLLSGSDFSADPERSSIELPQGEMLLMPSSHGGSVGVKITTVAPGNSAIGLPRINAVYALFDPATLEVQALFDGVALTSLRTPAMSAAAADLLAVRDASRLLVFGTGPQALGHVKALCSVRPITMVAVVGTNVEKANSFLARCREMGLTASLGTADSVEESDLIACCTSSPTPLFDGRKVHSSACVIAIGSHYPDRRELDEYLMGASDVYVEDRATALREAGDVIQAIELDRLSANEVFELSLATRRVSNAVPLRPTVFKGVGMAWQDLVIANACWTRVQSNASTKARPGGLVG